MVLWIYLYRIDLGDKLEGLAQTLFYIGSMCACIYIIKWGPHIGNFTPWLLLQYTLYVMLSVMVLSERFGFRQALCLGFLIVFLNSFYWEIFYHVLEFQVWLPYSLGFEWWYLRILQWLRLVPAFFLVKWFEIKDRWWLMLGLVISYGLTYARFTLKWGVDILHPAHRIICLTILVYTIYISPERK